MTSNRYRWFLVSVLILILGTTEAIAADALPLKPPPRTIYDITELLNQHRPDPETAKKLRDQLLGQPPVTDDKKELARFFKNRAVIGNSIGDSTAYAANLRKIVELGGDLSLYDDLTQLAAAELQIGNYLAADAAVARGLAGIPSGSNPGKRRSLFAFRAMVNISLGDFAAAQAASKEEENEFEISYRKPFRNRFINIWNLGHYGHQARMAMAAGKLGEAADLFQKVASTVPLVIEEAARERSLGEGTYYTDSHFEWIGNMASMSIAEIRVKQGRLSEAEIVARDALSHSIQKVGRYSFFTGSLIHPFAQILTAQGRYSEAEQMARAGIDIFEQMGTPKDSMWLRDLRLDLADSMVARSKYAGALLEYQRLSDAFAEYPAIQSQIGAGSIAWAVALVRAAKPQEALVMVDRLIRLKTQWMGAEHIDTIEGRGAKGMALAALGQRESALAEFRTALPILLKAVVEQGDEPSPLRSERLKLILEAYLGLLGEVRGTPLESASGLDAANEAFRIVDALRNQSTQGAVAASAARAAANDPRIGAEIRKEQDLAQEMVALHKILRDLMNAPADQLLPKVIADMKTRIEVIKKERVTLQADIEKRFPVYANLIRPQPPSLTEARAILQPGEALINIFATDTATYLWAFKKDGPVAFTSSKLTREELAKRVRSLRNALDPGDVDLVNGIPDFDLDTAHRLYTDLLAPIVTGWQGATHLLIATNGALGQLPLAVLPTAKVTVKPDPKLRNAQFKDVPWLIRQAAFTQLPSVNALVALRKLPLASAQRSAFVGFGDPQFTTTPTQVASNTRRLRNLSVNRPSQTEVEQAKPIEWMDYSKIPALPDTRDEILALAQALKADPKSDVFLGSDASKANVKKLDLSKRKVLAFATHGLLAGDFPGVLEPSLALANPGGGQPGLLTLEDIMGLKLDADWVVLSACNTAGGDGLGADALSGLGRGFFYAGSRALLVTHWPVESVSARLLVVGLFERQAADPKLSRAEALRQSMLTLMQQKSNEDNFAYAHPLFWAPYTLVGEGGN